MTLSEALDAVRVAGAVLVVDEQGPLLRGRVPPEVVGVLREHRDRVAAILKLREIHRSMGFCAADIKFIEDALLSGAARELRIAVRPPAAVPA